MLPLILVFAGVMLISLMAQARVKSAYNKYSKATTQSGITGAEAAARIMEAAGIRNVTIHSIKQTLADHYDPKNKRLVLSEKNYHGSSPAALGVAAHECGHAIQDKAKYAPLQLRMAAVSITGVASQMVMWIPILGMVTGMIAPYTGALLMVVAWGILMGFNLVTLPVEFDASRRAKLILDNMGFIRTEEERKGVNSVLNAAALTYVAAFVTSLVFFLWHLMPLLLGRRD